MEIIKINRGKFLKTMALEHPTFKDDIESIERLLDQATILEEEPKECLHECVCCERSSCEHCAMESKTVFLIETKEFNKEQWVRFSDLKEYLEKIK